MDTPDSQLPAGSVSDPSRATESRLLELPVELFLQILDLLSPRDCLRVSHTCRPLRNVAIRDWPLMARDLSTPTTKLQFIAAYVNSSLNYWVCLQCVQFHAVEPIDTPSFTYFGRFCRDRECHKMPSYFPMGYTTRQQHIQAALKYTAARDSLDADQEEHLQELLAESTQECPILSYGPKRTSGSRMRLHYHVKPKIVDGHYLLGETWTYRPTDPSGIIIPAPLTWADFRHARLKIYTCPHLDGNEEVLPDARAARRGLFPSTDFEQRLKLLMSEAPHRVVACSCPRCPTDVEVSYEQGADGGQALVVRAFKDLGVGTAMGGNRAALELMARVDPGCTLAGGERPVNRWPGDARSMYVSGKRLARGPSKLEPSELEPGKLEILREGARRPEFLQVWRRQFCSLRWFVTRAPADALSLAIAERRIGEKEQ